MLGKLIKAGSCAPQSHRFLGRGLMGSVPARENIPDRFIVKPIDIWTGNATTGKELIHALYGSDYNEAENLELFNHNNKLKGQNWLNSCQLDHVVLRDLCSSYAPKAIQAGRHVIADWIAHHPKPALRKPIAGKHVYAENPAGDDPWAADIMGVRLFMWAAYYDFFMAEASHDAQDDFFESFYLQAMALARMDERHVNGIAALKALRGLLAAGLAMPGQGWAEKALAQIEVQIKLQSLADGAHISRNPQALVTFTAILLDMRGALKSAAYDVPDMLQSAIERAGPALRFFRYNDKGLAVFNGGQEGNYDRIDAVLAQCGARIKPPVSLKDAGYERVVQGRSLLLLDTGRSAAKPFDGAHHAAPLAFEFCHGKDRIFVNCGTHPAHSEMRESLRATAAHSTAILDDRNAFEITGDGHLGRVANTPKTLRQAYKDGVLLEASHDGYVGMNGINHARALYLDKKGFDLRGQDSFARAQSLDQSVDIALRFHIHPKVLVSLIREGQEALLRLPGGIGWRFRHDCGVLALEDSLYIGQGNEIRKTKQLVIYGQFEASEATIKWSLKREGV